MLHRQPPLATVQQDCVCAYACRRFYLEIEGKQRFRVVECWEQDGYRVARPQYFSDNPPPAASEAQISLASMCQSVDQLANIWLDKVRWGMQHTLVACSAIMGAKALCCKADCFTSPSGLNVLPFVIVLPIGLFMLLACNALPAVPCCLLLLCLPAPHCWLASWLGWLG